MVLTLSILGIIILLAGLFGTLALAGKGDQEYRKSTKQNVTRLTFIYLLLAVIIIIGFGLYFYL
ncbi:hypothetical protein JOC85_001713 [Bacillus mesophilus]|uniref:Group-specific protein n=1 Tax=Bacillus mesophilus TaxID=1808955 RepID=A0A6M0Q558_9BACI|nr:hypothetical protein [Bacillus mesophilus]MBM7660941.1 hypothetical protein [Bacillus mesophilus]NEY71516.1 hypothetical protein [Bacillus mesophilus]